jgi:hypothetical protein
MAAMIIVTGLMCFSGKSSFAPRPAVRGHVTRAPASAMEQRGGTPSEQRDAAEEELASWMEPATANALPADAFELRETELKGLGLFATRSIHRGIHLFNYEGKLLPDSEYDGLSDYAVGVENKQGVDYVYDAQPTPRRVGSRVT